MIKIPGFKSNKVDLEKIMGNELEVTDDMVDEVTNGLEEDEDAEEIRICQTAD
jgi:hypothetical protein